MDKYGVEHSLQSEIVIDKMKATNMDKYGVEYPSQLEIVKDKMISNQFG